MSSIKTKVGERGPENFNPIGIKICLLTCNIGGIDEVILLVEQSVPYDYYCFTETPLPCRELSNRMKARFIRMTAHRYMSYGYFIFIDGRISITSPTFVEDIVAQTKDIAVTKHDQRSTVGEEYNFMLRLMESEKNEYLLSRYDVEVLKKERLLMSADLPLYAVGVMCWANTAKVRTFMEAWWQKCIEYSAWEQCWFSELARVHELQVTGIGYEGIVVKKHKKLM